MTAGAALEQASHDGLVAVTASVGPVRATPSPPLRVLLISEGTYPYTWGGVSTWCDSLVHILPDVSFHVLAITSEAGLDIVWDLPPNVRLHTVPLWGIRDIKESWPGLPLWRLHRARAAAASRAVAEEFVPAFRGFLREILAERADPFALAACAHTIYRFLEKHDLQRTLRERAVWQACRHEMVQGYSAVQTRLDLPPLELWELTTGFQWVSRWLFPLAQRLPEVDVVHAAMAGLSGLVAVVAKLEHHAGLQLTEHGVYLRERFIDESRRTDSVFLKLLNQRFARATTEMTYALADQISPCCDYNQRWELEVGATKSQLETIYYGVDSRKFSADEPASEVPRTVVWVARINPLKDVETLLRAAAVVVGRRPDARFMLFGSAAAEDAEYYQRCLALHAELNLHDVVEFCGYTDQPATAFASGDIVALSSISEGFPYSTLEAMLCGRPVVATAVGGIPEQIEGGGIAVPPRDPEAMGEAILSLLNDPTRCRALGLAARERAATEFSLDKFSGTQRSSYLRLSPHHEWARWLPNGSSTAAEPPTSSPREGLVEPFATSVLRNAALDKLTVDVQGRISKPLDVLEVAAVIESMGMSDAMARERFGRDDTFQVAAAVLAKIRSAPEGITLRRERPRDLAYVPPGRGTHLDTARHPVWAVVPSAALLLVIWGASSLGSWPPSRVLALALGMSSGILLTSGLTLAVGRRASNLISLGKGHAARRLLIASTFIGTAVTAGLTKCLVLLHLHDFRFLAQQQSVFLLSASALATIWVLAGALSLVSLSGLPGTALLLGIGCAAAVNFALVPLTGHHLVIAMTVAFVVTVLTMAAGLAWALRPQPGARQTNERLPSLGYLLLEALPNFVYGTLAAILFGSIHVIGWIKVHGGPQVSTLELGLFLPLVPAALGAGRAEQTLRRFWAKVKDLQQTRHADQPRPMRAELRGLYRAELWRYLASLVIASDITTVVVGVLLIRGAFRGIAPSANPYDVLAIYLTALVGYASLSMGYFNSMFCLSLVRPAGPMRAIALGCALTVLLGCGLAYTLGFRFLPLALVFGGAAYWFMSYRAVQRLLDDAEYHYETAL
jgi:polysaccharide biosynthesis protein PelF